MRPNLSTRSLLAVGLLVFAGACGDDRNPEPSGPNSDPMTGGTGGEAGGSDAAAGGQADEAGRADETDMSTPAPAIDAAVASDTVMDTGPTACGLACSETAPICDLTSTSCRKPKNCDLCNVDADCATGSTCYTLEGQKMCVSDGAACQAGAKCCSVDFLGNGYSTSTCNPNVSCSRPGGKAALPPRMPDAGADAVDRKGPRCAPCKKDSECEVGLVCGMSDGFLNFCVTRGGSAQCCIGDTIRLCFAVDGSKGTP
jgi:hypothetical protein